MDNDQGKFIIEATIKAFLDKITPSGYLKKKYYIMRFGPKAKSKKNLRLVRIKEEGSNKVYIVNDKAKKYYWIKTQKTLNELGYAMSDTRNEISISEIKDYIQENAIC